MATPLLSLPRGRRAGQVAPSSAARLEAPAERLAVKDQAVLGFGGGQLAYYGVPYSRGWFQPSMIVGDDT